MRPRKMHPRLRRFVPLLFAAVLLSVLLCACGSRGASSSGQDAAQASAQGDGQTGASSGEKADISEKRFDIVGSWKVTNGAQGSAALIYDFKADGTVDFSLADFGAMEETRYGSALMTYLRTGTYTYDAETGSLDMETELCGFTTYKSTKVVFSADGSDLTFTDLNESCRKTAFSGLAVSDSTEDLIGSWKNLSVSGGLDIITFGEDGTISYTCSDYDSLSRDKQLEIVRALRDKSDYQYAFADSSTISVYRDYAYFGDIRFVIYGGYMTLVTFDESGVTPTTYRRAGPEDNTAPIGSLASQSFTVKTTSLNYASTDSEDTSRHSFIQCQLPAISGAPEGSDVDAFNSAMGELLAEITAIISSDTQGMLYEISTSVYEHPGVVDIVMATTTGGIYADTITTWKVYHFDSVTGESLTDGEYLALFGVTGTQAAAWIKDAAGYLPQLYSLYFDAGDRLYALLSPGGGTATQAPVHIH